MANDLCCDDIIGGEVYITVKFNRGGFEHYEGLGDARIQPTRLERTAGATTAGRIWVTERSRPVRAILSYANRCTSNPMRLFEGRCKIDVTIVEKSRGFWHLFTNALIVGSPEINLATGEITGMEIVTDDYKVTINRGVAPGQELVEQPDYYAEMGT